MAQADCAHVSAETEIELLESRMLNPRKIFTRCKLVTHLAGCRKVCLTISSDAETDPALLVEKRIDRVIFTCGGTAGHVNPAIAVAQLMAEKNPQIKILFVGAERGLEKDLIPKAGYDFRTVHISSFHRSFNDVYALRPQQLQLGFLKVLKGSHMKEMTEEYGIVHKELEPYEVLGTRWLPYEDILKLKMVESIVELYYNSGQFQNTIACVEPLFEDAFTLYEKLGQFYEKKGYSEISHSRMRRYEILLEFVKEELEEQSAGKSGNQDPEVENPAGKAAEDCRGMETATWEKVADSMIYDLYLRENLKSHPSFEYDQKPYEKAVWEYRRQEKVPRTAHIEVFRDGKILLFEYENRDPLLHNAAVKEIQI